MKQLLSFLLFLLVMAGGVAATVAVFGDDKRTIALEQIMYAEDENVPLATSIDLDLSDIPETFALLSEVFDEPISTRSVKQIYMDVSDPSLDERILHHIVDLDVMFEGRMTTLTVEAEVDREDGVYVIFYFKGDEDVVLALDDRINAYYEELGI
ncbi:MULTISPECIES: hypothetical protein [Exiguobacterium]|uniref:hypothetical protein n=1 Tax=Exiguobacterium TaxID=33986 RepID=UPI001BE65C52|nr:MULTISPECIES: hypothetical protein [Exiguobacterium]MCT4784551.1 hypothetical protein [Exiguobacterium himgiriensis]